MNRIKTRSVELNEDFIQALQENQIYPQRAEVRTYDDKRTTIEIYIECCGVSAYDFEVLSNWGLSAAVVCPVGPQMMSIYDSYLSPDTINKIIKEGGES